VPDTDPAALVAAIRERNEAYIKSMAFTEATVREMPSGDLRLALAAVDAVLEQHKPKQLHEWVRRVGAGFPCGHDLDGDWPQHYEGADGMTYCRDKPTVVVCSVCSDGPANDLMAEWPCATYLAISCALLGEGAGDG
jgi:hypothetical protein